jgi:predicted ester cyclase
MEPLNAPDHVANKRLLRPLLAHVAESRPDEVEARLGRACLPDAAWRGSHPLNEMTGVAAVAERVWKPLLHAFSDLERRETILIAGTSAVNGQAMVATVGHYCGTFRRDWLGIPATGLSAYLRFGEVYRMEDGRIAETTALWDLLDLMRQAGVWPVARSLGIEEQWPAPITGDGIALDASDPSLSAASLAQTLAMQATLGAYDDEARAGRQGLLDMPQKEHWHPRMMWYGPAGIGTARGLAGFVDCHQLPFRIAFPNRRGGNHYLRIGDGPFSATGGWPSVLAKHSGGGFMGLPPTGRDVTMRVMDFYLHHEGLIRENWVPLDIIHLLLQMDVDVFARMRQLVRRSG